MNPYFRLTAVLLLIWCDRMPAMTQPVPAELEIVPPLKNYAEEYHPTLKDNPELPIYGPDGSECVKFEPAGLRITLPLGYAKQRPGTGVVTDFGITGDFEITVAFEILAANHPKPPAHWASLQLVIVPNEAAVPDVWHKASQNRSGVVREITARDGAGTFLSSATQWRPDLPRDKWGNEDFSKIERQTNKRAPTKALTGRLRLVRSGADLYFLTSEDAGPNFKVLLKHEFGTKDLKNVRVLASTGGPGDALDCLVTDLHIRADGFVKQANALAMAPGAPARWITAPVIIALAIGGVFVLLVPVGLVFFLRKREKEPPSEAVSILVFACSHCGKKMKAKSMLAGKKLKCPQCGSVVKAPADAEERT